MTYLFLLIELLFFFSGAFFIGTRRVPPRLLQLFFGQAEYQMTGNAARRFGLVLALPLLIMMVVPVTLFLLWGNDALTYMGSIEVLILMGDIALCAYLARLARV